MQSHRPGYARAIPPKPASLNRRGSNHLLSLLPAGARERLVGGCTPIPLRLEQTLHVTGEAIQHVYFPLSGAVSLVLDSREGGTVEVGMVGNEGVLGTAIALGADCSEARAVVQCPGEALRIKAGDFREALRHSAALMRIAQRFVQAMMVQIAQSVMCNRLHSMESRLSRWLLMVHDRAGVDDLRITQEFMAQMLGVRRASVTVAAGTLHKDGAIGYARGRIKVLDRAGLETAACECYARVIRETLRLFDADRTSA